MEHLLDEGSTLLLTTSRTTSAGNCVRKNPGPEGDVSACSRGTAVPKGAASCRRALRCPGAETTKRLFMEAVMASSAPLRRASVPNDLVSGVAGRAGRPLHYRAVLVHKISGAHTETVWNRGTGEGRGGISINAVMPRFQHAVSGRVSELAAERCGRAA